MEYQSSYWLAFSYVTNNTHLGKDIDLGHVGDHQKLILYIFSKTFYVYYQLTPFQWHTICLIWDGVKGRLKLLFTCSRIQSWIILDLWLSCFFRFESEIDPQSFFILHNPNIFNVQSSSCLQCPSICAVFFSPP